MPHVKRVATEDPLADLRRLLVRPLEEVDEGVAVVAVEAVGHLLAGHGDLLHVLGQLDLGLPVDLDQLVNATEGGLPLASH